MDNQNQDIKNSIRYGNFWTTAASEMGNELCGLFDNASLINRLAWGAQHNFERGVVYCRCTTKNPKQQIVDQVQASLEFAAFNRIYVPNEFIFWDCGSSADVRPGFEQMKDVLYEYPISTVVADSYSQVFRNQQDYLTFSLILDELNTRIALPTGHPKF